MLILEIWLLVIPVLILPCMELGSRPQYTVINKESVNTVDIKCDLIATASIFEEFIDA
jgi:hypothetical protein